MSVLWQDCNRPKTPGKSGTTAPWPLARKRCARETPSHRHVPAHVQRQQLLSTLRRAVRGCVSRAHVPTHRPHRAPHTPQSSLGDTHAGATRSSTQEGTGRQRAGT